MVSAFTAEPRSADVRIWLDAHAADIGISVWVVTEFSGALAMKRRLGTIDEGGRQAVMRTWRSFCVRDTTVQPVETRHFVQAARLMDRGDLKLRSGDALHLALVLERGWSIATLDHDLAAAAGMLGVQVELMPA